MNATLEAPDLTPGYPSKGRKLGPAWEELWAALAGAGTEFQDGRVLAELIAPKHGLAPATLVALISRAGKAEILERKGKPVKTNAGMRTRTHYRVAAKYRRRLA